MKATFSDEDSKTRGFTDDDWFWMEETEYSNREPMNIPESRNIIEASMDVVIRGEYYGSYY